MDLAGSEFLDSVRFHARSLLPARSIVMEYLTARGDVDPSGEIMVLDRFFPWKLHLFELEVENKKEARGTPWHSKVTDQLCEHRLSLMDSEKQTDFFFKPTVGASSTGLKHKIPFWMFCLMSFATCTIIFTIRLTISLRDIILFHITHHINF